MLYDVIGLLAEDLVIGSSNASIYSEENLVGFFPQVT